MPPQISILAQSENKSKFLERLGIPDHTEEGKRIYAMMKEEAIAGRARMSASPSSLLPQLINDPNVKPPYSNTQISEAAMHRETLYIYRTARPETRVYYERGHYLEGDTEENWIIKWLLWHVFRYRDNRNRGRTMPSWVTRNSQGADSSGTSSTASSSQTAQTPQPPSAQLPSPYSTYQQVSPLTYATSSHGSSQSPTEPRGKARL
ncbi:hypothetical protein CAC42_2839 [Sphaceloma murrayae]|uniref:Uncharacterized protein n=1 Tax=Sphaceloma murrayae TaxID=2082308 RepID=A0A2K1R0U1_9PEZI|nr:hypothetical protein CAC42_2839 [Sphaceloma murrayae]